MAAWMHVVGVLALFAAAALHPRLTGRRRHLAWASGPLLIGVSLAATGDTFILFKWLPLLLMPLGLLWLSLIALACWQLATKGPAGRWLTALVLAFWLTSSNPLACFVVDRLEAGYAPPNADERLEAVLVLGGGTSITPHGGVQVTASGDRVVTAARLYHRGVAQRIVVSGQGVAALDVEGQARDLGGQAREILLELGVPDTAIEVWPGGRNTREEVARFRELTTARGWQRVGLLTSAWHLRRAMLHAERAGLDAVPVPSDFRGAPPIWSIVEVVPSAAGAYDMRLAAWEALGILLRR